ncbi:hypothetical protein STRDD11_02565 [Streptococcus sp. DD11]|uniref:hypothetical protein n=1 Tax=Streptococcus sp. DD11 TaxID=1777879 RepID=UPI000799FCF7|nr:hypothetical protein [Streptococcus sp. DD11]KXT77505.1 hypothetical protein STRDD11_02565 [Streptococcus sp. DD11]
MEFEVFTLKFNDLGDGFGLKLENEILDCSINLESEETTDLKDFFDKIFDYIIETGQLIEFQLENHTDKALFQFVAEDLIKQVNAEIKDSAMNFEEIIAFKSQTSQ